MVFAVKEIPPDLFEPGKAYVFFAHVIKGQPYNMPMLRRLLDLGCTLIDYEKVTADEGRRLIFFGWHAGVAGMLETLWALGRRLAWEGIPTPLTELQRAFEYRDIAEAKVAVAQVGRMIAGQGCRPRSRPLTIGVAGYGNVARGAWEILNLLPVEVIAAGRRSPTSRPAPGAIALHASTRPPSGKNTRLSRKPRGEPFDLPALLRRTRRTSAPSSSRTCRT